MTNKIPPSGLTLKIAAHGGTCRKRRRESGRKSDRGRKSNRERKSERERESERVVLFFSFFFFLFSDFLQHPELGR